MQYSTDDEGYVTCGRSGPMTNYDWVHIYEEGVWRVEMSPHTSGYFEPYCCFVNYNIGMEDDLNKRFANHHISPTPENTGSLLASDLKIEFSLSDKDEDLINSIFWVYNYRFIRSAWKSTSDICNLGTTCAELRDRYTEVKYPYKVAGSAECWKLYLNEDGVPEGAYLRVGENWLVIVTDAFIDEL